MPQRLPEVTADDGFKNAFLESLRTPATAKAYERDLCDFADKTGSDGLPQALMDLLNRGPENAHRLVHAYLHRLRGKATSTINRRLSVLRSLTRFAHSKGIIQWGLEMDGLKPKRTPPPSPIDLEAVKRVLRKKEHGTGPSSVRDYAILRLITELALKRSEIRRLNVSDFDPMLGTVRLPRPGEKKRSKLPISEKTNSAIQTWLLIRPGRAGGALFVNLIPRRHARLSGEGICQIVRKSGEAGCGTLLPKHLRAASIVGALKLRGAHKLTYESISKFSGFKSAATLSRYISQAEETGPSVGSTIASHL